MPPSQVAKAPVASVRRGSGQLHWPLRGVLYARFGRKGKSPHDGIDLAAPAGTPVRTAGEGSVLFAGPQQGYGLLVIIEHAHGLVTVYAHNRDLRVRTGQQIREGQVIATVGESGKTSGPHLHFEVRQDGAAGRSARDPRTSSGVLTPFLIARSGMRSEREKMLAGELYDPLDPELVAARDRARDLCQALNATREAEQDERRAHPAGAVRRRAATASGCSRRSSATTASNIPLGERVFFNFNCVVLDVCQVTDRRLHAVRPGGADLHRHAPDGRRRCAASRSSASPIEIGSDVWVGGGAIICPGVRIGSRSVIGAGSVVTRDIPDGRVRRGQPVPGGQVTRARGVSRRTATPPRRPSPERRVLRARCRTRRPTAPGSRGSRTSTRRTPA